MAEIARLKRQLAQQDEELAIVKNVWSAPVSQDIFHDSGGKAFASMYSACLCHQKWRLALMEFARIDPHKAFGYENRFFNQAGNAPNNDCAIT